MTTYGMHIDLLHAIMLKAQVACSLIEQDPATARREIDQILGLARRLSAHCEYPVPPSPAPFALEVKNAQALLEAAGATVSVNIHATPDPMIDSPLRKVLRANVAVVLEHPGTPEVSISVDARRMDIHSVCPTVVSSPALQRLSRLKKVLALHGIRLITMRGEDELAVTARVVDL